MEEWLEKGCQKWDRVKKMSMQALKLAKMSELKLGEKHLPRKELWE